MAQSTPRSMAERDRRGVEVRGPQFEVFGTSNRSFLACLVIHAPRPVVLGDFSAFFREDVPHDGLGQDTRSWMDSS